MSGYGKSGSSKLLLWRPSTLSRIIVLLFSPKYPSPRVPNTAVLVCWQRSGWRVSPRTIVAGVRRPEHPTMLRKICGAYPGFGRTLHLSWIATHLGQYREKILVAPMGLPRWFRLLSATLLVPPPLPPPPHFASPLTGAPLLAPPLQDPLLVSLTHLNPWRRVFTTSSEFRRIFGNVRCMFPVRRAVR